VRRRLELASHRWPERDADPFRALAMDRSRRSEAVQDPARISGVEYQAKLPKPREQLDEVAANFFRRFRALS